MIVAFFVYLHSCYSKIYNTILIIGIIVAEKNEIMDLKYIYDNNNKWIKDKLSINTNYFNSLAKGQSPNILYFGCSDSRVVPETIMGISPGEMFVHRNIANMISNTDRSAMSVLAYAVTQLKVKHIIVCGHYFCGGITAAMSDDDLGILNPWLQPIKDVMSINKSILNQEPDETARSKKLVELNVHQQLDNIYNLPGMKDLLIDESIQLHGWIFDIETGKLIDISIK